MCVTSFSSVNYLVRTVFLVDHPSQHPRAEPAELGEQERDWDRISQLCSGIPAEKRGEERSGRGGIPPSP